MNASLITFVDADKLHIATALLFFALAETFGNVSLFLKLVTRGSIRYFFRQIRKRSIFKCIRNYFKTLFDTFTRLISISPFFFQNPFFDFIHVHSSVVFSAPFIYLYFLSLTLPRKRKDGNSFTRRMLYSPKNGFM